MSYEQDAKGILIQIYRSNSFTMYILCSDSKRLRTEALIDPYNKKQGYSLRIHIYSSIMAWTRFLVFYAFYLVYIFSWEIGRTFFFLLSMHFEIPERSLDHKFHLAAGFVGERIIYLEGFLRQLQWKRTL